MTVVTTTAVVPTTVAAVEAERRTHACAPGQRNVPPSGSGARWSTEEANPSPRPPPSEHPQRDRPPQHP